MQLVTKDKKISIDELKIMSDKMFNKLVKAVVDIDREIMAVDASMHVDLEAFLLDEESELPKGPSEQDNLWGINFHPNETSDQEFVEFDSMINVRPLIGNATRYIDDSKIREKIIKITNMLIKK
jgi:hypothetical protein